MINMFNGCANLKAIIVGSNWDASSAHTESKDNDMFTGCTVLVGEDGTTVGTTVDGTVANTEVGGYMTKNTVNVTASSFSVDGGYWATYYKSNVNRVADSNTTVYAAQRNGSRLTLVEVAGKMIKAGEGVILKRTGSNSITLTSTAEAATDSYYDSNALTGCDVATAQTAGTTYYVLSYVDSTLGFYKLGSGNSLGANKAFMAVTSGGAPAFFDFGGETTGIDAVQRDCQAPAEVYDLQGRHVTAPTHGLYIVNGKKVIL